MLMLAPLAALVWVGVRAARGEEVGAERERAELATRRLEGYAALAAATVADLERQLLAATARLPADPAAIRTLAREQPRLRRLVVLEGRRLVFPPEDAPTSEDERRFVARRRDLWERGPLSNPPREESSGRSGERGWLPLDGGEGPGLLHWQRDAAGRMVAVEVSGAALLAAIVARLPATGDRESTPERISLHDGARRLAYAWGTWEPPAGAQPLAVLDLAAPLGAWRLSYLAPPVARGGAALGIAAGLAALLAAVAGLAVWFYRESTRDLRLAAQRVSFVNQVSHELKTPLTNVRMYAELLEDHLPPDDPVARKRLAVVVAESQRLGRLITNILALARKDRGQLTVHPTAGCVDELVREAVEQQAPWLRACGVEVRLDLAAPAPVLVDPDALAQIMGNLLGNVVKYAPGGPAAVSTTQAGATTTVIVRDSGPGIPGGERARIFEPFVRLGRQAHEGAPGTGIGLGIARDLARQHGGDLVALPAGDQAGAGAVFRLSLHTPPAAAAAEGGASPERGS